MSYDILIFEPDAVTDEDFPQWWEQVSRWEEPRDYDTTEGSTPAIRAFYRDLIRAFPPFNGPDYTIGADYIYIGVGWSDANALVKIVGQMAWTQRLAVAYVSEDSSIFRP